MTSNAKIIVDQKMQVNEKLEVIPGRPMCLSQVLLSVFQSRKKINVIYFSSI